MAVFWVRLEYMEKSGACVREEALTEAGNQPSEDPTIKHATNICRTLIAKLHILIVRYFLTIPKHSG